MRQEGRRRGEKSLRWNGTTGGHCEVDVEVDPI
jgi:hypothetical protein